MHLYAARANSCVHIIRAAAPTGPASCRGTVGSTHAESLSRADGPRLAALAVDDRSRYTARVRDHLSLRLKAGRIERVLCDLASPSMDEDAVARSVCATSDLSLSSNDTLLSTPTQHRLSPPPLWPAAARVGPYGKRPWDPRRCAGRYRRSAA